MEEQKAAKPKPGVLKSIWDFFSSVKLTVVLLIILALVSIIGTVIDQTDPSKNLRMLVGLFGPGGAQGALDWLVRLGLTNMYHSTWFVSLLILLCINITVCTVERLPHVVHMVTRVQGPLTDETLKGLAVKKELKLKGEAERLQDKAREAMRSLGYRPKTASEDGALHCYAERGKYSRLGVYITHSSVLVIFIGALIGSFWGYKGYVQISEGETINSIGIINKPLLRNFGKEIPLDFSVRCDKFTLKLYENSRMPSDYLSTLTVVDAGREMDTKTIRVNDPLEYNHIRFYQSSYGVMPGKATMTIRATAKGGSINIRDYQMRRDEKVHLEGTSYDMALTDMSPDVAIGPNNQLIAQSDQFKGSAAAALRIFDDKGNPVDQAMIISAVPDSQPQRVPFDFKIMDYNGPYYTGLQVTYDPGVWVVWAGCTLLVLGILIAFFTYHKRLWIRIVPGEKGAFAVTVAGSSNKNRHAFEGEFGRLVDRLAVK